MFHGDVVVAGGACYLSVKKYSIPTAVCCVFQSAGSSRLMLDEFIHEPRVAYFSMEIALQNDMHNYSGGLGVLAGDTIRSAADLELPMVAVTLISRQGYFRQIIDADGRQIEQPQPWDPTEHTTPLAA